VGLRLDHGTVDDVVGFFLCLLEKPGRHLFRLLGLALRRQKPPRVLQERVGVGPGLFQDGLVFLVRGVHGLRFHPRPDRLGLLAGLDDGPLGVGLGLVEELLALLLEGLLDDLLLPGHEPGRLGLGVLDDLLCPLPGVGDELLGQRVGLPRRLLLPLFQLGGLLPGLLQDRLRLGLGLVDHLLAFRLEFLDQDLFLPSLQLRGRRFGVLDDLFGLGPGAGEKLRSLRFDVLRLCLGVLDDLLGLGLRLGEQGLCLLLDLPGKLRPLRLLEDGGLFAGLLEDLLGVGLRPLDFLPGGIHLPDGEGLRLPARRADDFLRAGPGLVDDLVCLPLGPFEADR